MGSPEQIYPKHDMSCTPTTKPDYGTSEWNNRVMVGTGSLSYLDKH